MLGIVAGSEVLFRRGAYWRFHFAYAVQVWRVCVVSFSLMSPMLVGVVGVSVSG